MQLFFYAQGQLREEGIIQFRTPRVIAARAGAWLLSRLTFSVQTLIDTLNTRRVFLRIGIKHFENWLPASITITTSIEPPWRK